MSLSHSRRCIDLVVRGARHNAHPWQRRPLLAGLVLQTHRCYASKAKGRAGKQEAEDTRDADAIMRDYEVLRMMAHKLPIDPWAQPVPTMDLHIPSLRSRKKNATLMDHLSATGQTLRNCAASNDVLNARYSLRRMAKDKGFPDTKVRSGWSWRIFTTQSTSNSAWIASLRNIALDTYKRVNQALADRDEKVIKQLAVADMQSHYIQLVRSQDASRISVWKFHGERSPCRVEVPGNGSRLLVQALVRFDTLQSLEVYSKRGTLLRGQSEPKPVVEYLVLQKRMWYDTPWTIRDRLYEGVDTEYESITA
ncbi:hypothetical protein IEO21_09051 [Rhodonia placenta]|uniref:Tim44-like domain-containing protein n=1 Tax=Rhodonia placenta TaxID=104341 RepID=A0A8H7TYU3_9APHY|nr:hypothetical protein IEO21_09051 [Postia placenta]